MKYVINRIKMFWKEFMLPCIVSVWGQYDELIGNSFVKL